MFSVYDDNAIMKEFDRVSKLPIENDMCGIIYSPNAVLESVDEPIMESDDGTTRVMPTFEAVKYSYGEGKSITVDNGKIVEVVGSKSLANYKGAGIKVKQGEQGKELTADIEVNGKWQGWSSHAPVTSVEGDDSQGDGTGASDDGTVVIKFANGCSVTLNKGDDGYVIGGSEGSSILSKLSGHLVNVDLNNIQEGQPLRMSIKVNDKFHGWHSGQPVSSVTNGEASNTDSQPNVEQNQEQPAVEPNPEQNATEQKPDQKAEPDDGEKVVIKMNGGRKFVFAKKSDGTVVLKDAGGSRTLSEYEGREAKFNNPPKVGEKLSLTFFGQAITRDTVLKDTPLTTSDTIAYVGSSDPGASDSTSANSTVTVVTLDNGRKLTFKLSPMNVPDNPKLKYQGVLVDSDGESLKNYLNSQVRCFELAEGKPFVAALNVGGKWKAVYGGHSVKSVERQ